MALIDTIIEGETIERGPFTLKRNGTTFDLTGMTVALVIRPAAGTDYSDTAGEVRIAADRTTGIVYFTPDADDFLAREKKYSIRWKVTDGAGTVIYFPNTEEPDTIAVGKP